MYHVNNCLRLQHSFYLFAFVVANEIPPSLLLNLSFAMSFTILKKIYIEHSCKLSKCCYEKKAMAFATIL
jgi:hypothetical protein